MNTESIPKLIPNWIDGEELEAVSGENFEKLSPVNGEVICNIARSSAADVQLAVESAKRAQPAWSKMPSVNRGMVLHDIVNALIDNQSEMAAIVARETGKSFQAAYGETGGAIQLGLFYASEGQRLYGRTMGSGVDNRYWMTIREPVGIAGLIIAANTPIANVAWKVFPALICGNTAVLKAAEDTPATAWFFGQLAKTAGLPPGVLNIVQGYGKEAGAPLVEHADVGVVSFTGSTAVGRYIQQAAGERLAKVSLELGGKNPLVVCEDANLESAIEWTIQSAFSNAGQRCASGSRIIVFDAVYEEFRSKLIDRTKELKVGCEDSDDLGPVINQKQLDNMLHAVERARKAGANILVGGERLTGPVHGSGFYMAPTLIESAAADDEISTEELFGPITCLYRARDYSNALALANQSPYGLTACIHTQDFTRALHFSHQVMAGTVMVNGGTFGSEPHMAFGGVKQSGNGSREPGTEALDIYSSLKTISMNIDPSQL